MTRTAWGIAAAALVGLAGCAPDPGDPKAELEALARDLRGKVEPLPALAVQDSGRFEAQALPDPFHPWAPVRPQDLVSRADRALLANYSSHAELERARARAVDDAARAVADAEERIARLRQRLQALAAATPSKSGPTTRSATQRKELEAELKRTEDLLAARRSESTAIQGWFADDLKRYAELTARRR